MVRVLATDKYTGYDKELDLSDYLKRHLVLEVGVIRGLHGSRLSIKLLLEKETGYQEYTELCEDSVDIKDIVEGL